MLVRVAVKGLEKGNLAHGYFRFLKAYDGQIVEVDETKSRTKNLLYLKEEPIGGHNLTHMQKSCIRDNHMEIIGSDFRIGSSRCGDCEAIFETSKGCCTKCGSGDTREFFPGTSKGTGIDSIADNIVKEMFG